MNKKTKKLAYNIFIIALIITGIFYVCSRFIHLGKVEFTDDAQVCQLLTPINCRVQGFIKKIYFKEFQHVHKGDTLAIIEDSEYRLQLAQAEAALSTATAGHSATSTSVSVAANNIRVSDADMEETNALLENADRELKRYKNLLAQKAVTRQQYDKVETEYRSLKARYRRMNEIKTTSALTHSEQSNRLSQSEASIKLAEAKVELARLNLSYTVIIAPCDGFTGRKDVLEGQLIQPGQSIVNIVSDEDIWVTANYRETQLRHIAEGAAVDIKVDAIAGLTFKGSVERISKATEKSYSLVPNNNVAGNFVKVEQRVPVRIRFTKANKHEDIKKLRSGLSVECTLHY